MIADVKYSLDYLILYLRQYAMELFLCRHGKTDHNEQGIVQGKMETEINEKGKGQAENLRDRLSKQDISKVYSSNMKRAIQTAEIISKKHNIDIEITEKLNEAAREKYEGEKTEELITDVEESEIEDYLWKSKGGENLKEVQQRSVSFLNEINKDHEEDESIIVVSHGGTIRCILLGIIGHLPKNGWGINQQNCSINRLTWTKDEGWLIQCVNDTNHLG
jgi:Fructose-2,6-bisphosphatase